MHLNTFKYMLPVLALGAIVSSAFADCEEDQEDMVGKAVAAAASVKVATLIPGAGKQMISLETCEVSGGGFNTTFKFNVIGADGLYWVQGRPRLPARPLPI